MEQPFYRLSCKALVYDETRTRIMIFQEENGRYDFPGGWLDFGETPQANIARELLEESWLEVTRVADHPSYMIAGEKDDGKCRIANVFYETKLNGLDFTISDECHALKFVTKEEALKLDLYSTVRMFFEQLP